MKRLFFILTVSLALTACSNPTADKYNADNQTELISDSLLESKFAQLTKRAIADSTITFRLDSLTNFLWDTLIIIQPYYPIDTLEKRAHTNLPVVGNHPALLNDGENILAFIKDGQLTNYVRVPRDKGDFCSIDGNVIFSIDSCVFEFVRTPNRFTTGQSIVEAKIKR